MNHSGDALRVLKEGIVDLGEWLPPATKAELALLQNSYNAAKAVCDTLKETGKCDGFGDFRANIISFQKAFNEKFSDTSISEGSKTFQNFMCQIQGRQ